MTARESTMHGLGVPIWMPRGKISACIRSNGSTFSIVTGIIMGCKEL